MRDIIKLNTIEDLVNAAVKDTTNRYKLSGDTYFEYDDPAAGQKWEDDEESVIGKWVPYGTDGHKEYQQRKDNYRKTMPKKHAVKVWYLRESYDDKYQLSPDLGDQIDAVWTKKETRYSRTLERTGVMTLAGILKRMGRTDVAQKIKDAKKEQEAATAKTRRNNLRDSLNRKLAELETWVNQYGKELGITAEMFQLPVELADRLQKEE